MKHLSSEFSPSIWHPYYFIRSSLRDGISEKASKLSGRLLDFGCGSKPYRSLFQVEEYIGVDFENEGHPHENEQIDFFYDGKSLPFPDNNFESVLCSEVFEHIFNLDEVLKELNRVMRDGGKMLITCPFVWNEHEVPYDFARYTRFALEDMLRKNGFAVLEYSKAGDFISATTQLRVLYFHTVFYKPMRRFLLTRWVYKTIFVALPNIAGLIARKILPFNDSLYLNNVLLAQKVKS